jgi:prepilin peptidase CpaA
MNFVIDPFTIILLSSILVIAATIDLRVQKIPNLLTFPTMILGLIYYSITTGWNGLLFSIEGLALGIAIFIIPYLMGGMGAGDAKLMGAIGAIIGPKGVLLASLFTAIVGGIYALTILLLNHKYSKSFIVRNAMTLKTLALTGQFIPISADESEKKFTLCYGVAIAIGTISYLLLEFYGYNPV